MRLDSGLSLKLGSWFAQAVAAGSTLLDGLVSYWALDEVSGTRADAVGDNDLTDNNTVGVAYPGPSGTVASFVGANSESLSATSVTDFGNTDFTIVAWVYRTTDNADIFVSKDGSGTGRSFDMDMDGTYRFYVGGGGGGLATVTAPSKDAWHLVVGYHNASTNKVGISIDGATATEANSGDPEASTASFKIGARDYGGSEGYFDGRISGVGVWSRLLDAAEITSLFNSGNGKHYADLTAAEKVGLVSYWNLDESSDGSGAVTRVDSHGDNDLTDNGTTASTVNTATKNGNAASFINGNNEYLSVTASDIAAQGGDWSGSCWVFHTGQDYAAIIGTYNSVAGFGVFSRNNNTVDYYLHYSAGDRVIINAGCTPNAWHHIYIEYVEATKTAGISIDGGALGTDATNDGYTQVTALMIGGNLSGVIPLTGKVDEAAFWSRVLTADERTELYASGAGVYYNGSDFV